MGSQSSLESLIRLYHEMGCNYDKVPSRSEGGGWAVFFGFFFNKSGNPHELTQAKHHIHEGPH